MKLRDILIVASAFLLSIGVGFGAHQFLQSDGKYSSDISVRADAENQVAGTNFDENYIELRYEDTPEARFYFKFNDSRGVQRIEGLRQDGTLQTTTKIRSFGEKTYFIYLRYRDRPDKSSEEDYIEIYSIEEA